MPVSLHTATIGTYLQILPSVAGLVDTAEAHCREHGLPDEALAGARLADDMWPFAKQVTETAHHSARAILGVRSGVFGPEPGPAPLDFAVLKSEIADAIALLQAVDPAEIDDAATRPLRFEFGTRHMDFNVEDFLLSFSLPNFYFHSAAAYAVLRSRGLGVGKRDFLGHVRMTPGG